MDSMTEKKSDTLFESDLDPQERVKVALLTAIAAALEPFLWNESDDVLTEASRLLGIEPTQSLRDDYAQHVNAQPKALPPPTTLADARAQFGAVNQEIKMQLRGLFAGIPGNSKRAAVFKSVAAAAEQTTKAKRLIKSALHELDKNDNVLLRLPLRTRNVADRRTATVALFLEVAVDYLLGAEGASKEPMLAAIDGLLSNAEIAAASGVSIDAIKKRRTRSRKP